MKELDKVYDPSKIEPKIYEMWEKGGYFKPEVHPDGKPFTIVMPPPNITGQLHIGHAFDGTLQDILTRYKRMQGYSALWLPGEDHASIATEVKVVEHVKEKYGKTKQDMTRDEFLEHAWDWAVKFRERIAKQFRKLGTSCDWSRERFTMDEGCNDAVKETFVKLYNDGLIYRGNRIINWCVDCKTALSDAEVEYEEHSGFLWHIKYPIVDSDEFIIVATTRPETMLGDTGIAVHPDDKRYTHLHGKKAILPLVNKEIPIFADEYVEMEFGTGCVKITPAHDPNDFEVGKRHNLEEIRVLNDDGSINSLGGKYEGLDRYEARKVMVKELEDLGLMEKIEPISHNVGACYRCHKTVESITSEQWFVKMESLAKPAIEVVKNDETQFIPARFSKTYFNWMENIRDWCISRQLWWGHQIPAYYCDECGNMVVAKEMPHKCEKCSCEHFKQDEDALDTWFSSALWPYSTMGWPNDTEDFKKFYPNDVLVTGYDIIFFWVARMIFSGIYNIGKTPFHHVYIHGIVRDEEGRKMSKSLGNGVDPLEVIEKYGADALRFALITGNAAGNDTRWHESKVQSSRNFANKLNNAARFIMMNLEDYDVKTKIDEKSLINLDKWIISRCNEIIGEVTTNMDKYEMGIALEKLYNFIWTEFCDWYIEFAKARLHSEDMSGKLEAQYTLYTVFIDILKTLHPFMPFITEDIYSHMAEDEKPLIVAQWPSFDEGRVFASEQNEVSEIIEGIRGIRNARAKMNIPPSKKAKLYIVPLKNSDEIYMGNEDIFIKLASSNEVVITNDSISTENALCIVTNTARFIVPLDDLIDKQKEIERLSAEKKKLLGEIERINSKLGNENFVGKAPKQVIDGEKEKLQKYTELLKEVEDSLANY